LKLHVAVVQLVRLQVHKVLVVLGITTDSNAHLVLDQLGVFLQAFGEDFLTLLEFLGYVVILSVMTQGFS